MANFSTEIIITVEHLNYGNHVGYDSFLTISQEARMRWLKNHGLTELNLENGVGHGIGYIVTKALMEYKSEAFHGDILKVDVSCIKQHKKKFDFTYSMRNTVTNKIVAEGETSQVLFDYNAKKITSPPEKFAKLFLE